MGTSPAPPCSADTASVIDSRATAGAIVFTATTSAIASTTIPYKPQLHGCGFARARRIPAIVLLSPTTTILLLLVPCK